MADVFRVDCSGCHLSVQVDVDNAVVAVKVPSNGLRGAKHVAAHWKSEDATLDSGGDLILWDCPACGYADSTYADPATRKELT